MSSTEFLIAAFSLGLGLAAGATLVEVLRARPASRREVRITIAPGVSPARSATLATIEDPTQRPARRDARVPVMAPGTGPADGVPARQPTGSIGMPVEGRIPVAVGIATSPTPLAFASRPDDAGTRRPPAGGGGESGERPFDPVRAEGSSGEPAAGIPARASTPDEPGATDGSAALRARVDLLCGQAERLRALSAAAQTRLRNARRAYDEHAARRDEAATGTDPRTIRAAKDAAQAAFRRGRLAARDGAALDAAATAWLREINEINGRTRLAATVLTRETAIAAEMLKTVEQAGLEADGARIQAERASEACQAARSALADQIERDQAAAAPPVEVPAPAPPTPPMPGWDVASAPSTGFAPVDHSAYPVADAAVLRILRGDRAAMTSLVAELGGEDLEERRRWQILLSDLIDAIVARAIDAAALTFPHDESFWGPYSQTQCREIAAGLAALGYRFDGLGGFADERVPSQRDLSLALGYAGLDPMRVRRWPGEADLKALFRDVHVDAGRYLTEAAGGLTMGEMVDLLGRRAEPLADLWNDWGRVRPLLLAD